MTDRVAEAHEQLTQAVEALVSGEDWKAMLDVASRFHRYSLSNLLLIQRQRPDATRVAGYRTWQSLGRQVRKGEKGIKILAPVVRRVPVEDNGTDGEAVEVVRAFKVVHVFDLAQTDGEPLPELPAVPDDEAPEALWDALAAQVADAGYTVVRGDCGGPDGRTDYTSRQVTVADRLAPGAAVRTLAHELGHVLLHSPDAEVTVARSRAEVEAESVAYLVCTAAGMTSPGDSFPYVASWSGGKTEAVRAAAERAIGCARQVSEAAGLVPADAEAVPA